MTQIRDLFSDARKVERTIEKVIDYYENDPAKLDREVEEYEVTDNLERSYRTFLETYDAGVRLGDAPEVGIWVSGFYGSGKSSFTKYLGLALRGDAASGGVPIYERLAAKLKDTALAQDLRRLATKQPATVVFLDLARDQLIQNSAETITNVLYAKVLDFVGYSKVPKLAEVERRLDKDGRYEAFQAAYREMFPKKGEWVDIHDDPLIGPARGAKLIPQFFPDDFETAQDFRTQHYQHNRTVDDVAEEIVELLRRKKGCEEIVFVVDEVGQYVAANTQLMLNLDGLVRALKAVGRGKVWLVATAQQELDAIVERAVLNSAELYRLKDRFRSITLDASDIREITHRRLLTKSADGERRLDTLFKAQAEPLRLHTRVEGFGPGKDVDLKAFREMYPFLPVHFDVVMELIRRLARRTGGTGLRSAIRVIQDLLVDPTGSMKGLTPIARHEVGTLATAEDIYDALRNDLSKEFPHVVEGVDRVLKHKRFANHDLARRVAKAIAALQPLDGFPRTAENLAALLYPRVDAGPHVEAVRDVLRELVDVKELGIVEVRAEDATDDAASGSGYLYLSDRVRPFQAKRDEHKPTGGEKRQLQLDVLRRLFDPMPRTSLHNVRTVSGGLWLGSTAVAGEGADIRFVLEHVDPANIAKRSDELKTETRTRTSQYGSTVVWLVTWPAELDDDLAEACRSAHITRSVPDSEADRDVQQFLRAEKRRLERRKEAA
ncbi:MAG: BREX system P-loop protein BrxC, partial [Alphaproteobacteria bacterium]|nr:BREX system P-loop protein BrxC [Alphaproteobacteria bacterium]